MTPADLALIHAAAFVEGRPWSEKEFAELLQSDHVTLFSDAYGFALARTLAGETELLTLAVHPDLQGQGVGRKLTSAWLDASRKTARTAFLEVAADNLRAIQLYTSLGFATIATRPQYYARAGAASADAWVMQRPLTLGQHEDSSPSGPESG